jgi:hypothetical protein
LPLHTWGQNLHLHPHLHCIVPGGGLCPDGCRWIACRKDSFFLPYKILSRRFRKLFLLSLGRAFRKGRLHLSGELRDLAKPAVFQSMCETAAKLEWVVHVKPPFGGPRRVLKYLARYTHRVAISNHRLRALENGNVSFDWKDYADHSRTKTMTLDAVEFIRRFLLHVLPSGLVRIRHFGFLANRIRKQKLIQCRALLAASQPISSIDSDDSTTSVEDPHACPICKRGRLVIIELLGAETTAVQDSHDRSHGLRSRRLPRLRSEPRQISVCDRSHRCRKGLQPPVGIPCLRAGSQHSILQPLTSLDAFTVRNRKNTFNTQRLVPAPFNEFYPKRSGPTFPSLHAISAPEHFR